MSEEPRPTEEMEQGAPSMYKSMQEGSKMMDKILAAAQPSSVFSEPVMTGNYAVITAAEVTAGGGFGGGMGYGPAPSPGAETRTGEPEGQEGPPSRMSGGSGMGGGGGSMGRPVAVIAIGPEGVQVKPIIDPTKIALAAITAWGAMWLMFGKMRRSA